MCGKFSQISWDSWNFHAHEYLLHVYQLRASFWIFKSDHYEGRYVLKRTPKSLTLKGLWLSCTSHSYHAYASMSCSWHFEQFSIRFALWEYIKVHQPPVVTVVNPPSMSITPSPEHETLVPANTADDHSCICELCRTVSDIDLLQKYHQKCDFCGKPSSPELPLKPCARCLISAYYGKNCQSQAWKSRYKQECNKSIGE